MFEKLDLAELCSNPYEFDVVLSRQIYDAIDIALSYYKRIEEIFHENGCHVVRLMDTQKFLGKQGKNNESGFVYVYGSNWLLLGHRQYINPTEDCHYVGTFVREMQFDYNPDAYSFTEGLGSRYYLAELNSDEILGGSRLVLQESNGCNLL